MNTKQKKTLLGAIVTLILVGTIIVVALAVAGKFSKTDPERVEEVLKALNDALDKAGDGKEYQGGVFIKVQEKRLDAQGKTTQLNGQGKHGDKKATHKALTSVTVYGVKDGTMNRGNGEDRVNALESKLKEEKDHKEEQKTVVVVKTVHFYSDPISMHDSNPVESELLKLDESHTLRYGLSGKDIATRGIPVNDDPESDVMYFTLVEKIL